MAADVRLLGNGLRSIFTKVEASEKLHGLLMLFWEIYEKGRYSDAILSALYETTNRQLSVTESRTDWKEYKINFVSDTRMAFTGQEFSTAIQEDTDIIAQVRWMIDGTGAPAPTPISQSSPKQLFRTLGALTGLGRTLTLTYLEEYAQALYERGARIIHMSQNAQQGPFMVILQYEDVSVKLIVYVPDYLTAQYYHAHRT